MIILEIPDNRKIEFLSKIEFNNKDELLSSLSSLDELWGMAEITNKRSFINDGLLEINIYLNKEEDILNDEEIKEIMNLLVEYYSKNRLKSVKLTLYRIRERRNQNSGEKIIKNVMLDLSNKQNRKKLLEQSEYNFFEDWKNFVSFLNATNREEFDRIREFLEYIEDTENTLI